MSSSRSFVIRGITHDGRRFRPSDWAERLCGVMSQFGADGRMLYSPYVQPIVVAGVSSVAVDERLLEVQPLAYHFLTGFARDNELEVMPLEQAATVPAGNAGTRAAEVPAAPRSLAKGASGGR